MPNVMIFRMIMGLALTLSIPPVTASEPPAVAIIDLHRQHIPPGDAQRLTDRLNAALQSLDRFNIIDRESIRKKTEDLGFSPESCENRQCFQGIGNHMHADALVITHIEWPGSSPLFSIRIMDVHSGTIVRRGWLEGRTLGQLTDDIPRLVDQVFRDPLPTERDISPGFGVVLVDVTVDSTEIYLDNRPVGFSPVQGYIVKSGVHSVGVSRPGFIRESKTVEVSPGDTTRVSFSLTPRPVTGILELEIPEPDAVILIGDTERGRSPGAKFEFDPGIYQITVAKKEYVDWKKTYEIAAGDTIHDLVNLKKVPMGYVMVETSKDSIDIFLDNAYIGTSPIELLHIRSGIHAVGIRAPGYISESRTVEVFPGDTIYAAFQITPRPTTGNILLEINEDDAAVYINDEFAGRSPVEAMELEPGRYSITVRKRDFLDSALSIDVSAGKTTHAKINLKRAPFGIIYIDVSEDGAEVYMDNKRIGISPVPGYRISSGVHMVGVRRTGFFGESKRVEISPGDTVNITFNLQPRPQTRELLLEDEIIVK